jgi:hypothetical protein
MAESEVKYSGTGQIQQKMVIKKCDCWFLISYGYCHVKKKTTRSSNFKHHYFLNPKHTLNFGLNLVIICLILMKYSECGLKGQPNFLENTAILTIIGAIFRQVSCMITN